MATANHSGAAPLGRELSTYLDLARIAAALAVFLGHVSAQRLTGGFLWQMGAYMEPAVAVFFVLSGFVIGHVTQTRETDAASYALARIARLYSVALPAVALTLALDALGRAAAPALYGADWGYVAAGPWAALRALSFTQDLGWGAATLGSDLPYWSLNDEAWFYLMFGLTTFAGAGWGAAAALFAANLVGFRAIAPAFARAARRLRPPVAALAARTFSLYLYHLPVAQALAAFDPLPPSHPASRLLILGGTLAVVAALAQATERRKHVWRRHLGAALHWARAERRW